MNKLNDFFSYKIIDGELELSGYRLILLVVLIGFSIFFHRRVKKKLVLQNKIFKNEEKKNVAFNVFRILFFVAVLILTLNILDIPIRSTFLDQYLKVKFLELGKFYLSGYNILIITLLYFLTKLITKVIRSVVFDKNKFTKVKDEGRKEALFTILKYLVWIIVGFNMLDLVGLSFNAIIYGSAAFLVVIGFGLQGLFLDFISGVIILFEGSLEVGDIVQLKDIIGKVKKITLRTTHLVTIDEIDIIVPNSKLTTDNVINWSHSHNPSRFTVSVGVAYGSDVKKVKEILLDSAARHSHVVDRPAPSAQLMDFGDSSLVFELYFWTDRIFEIIHLKSDLRYMIEDQFREKGVRIPFPQRDVHLYNAMSGQSIPSDSEE